MNWIILIILLILLLSNFVKINFSEVEAKSLQEEVGTEINFIFMSVRFPRPLGWIVIKVNSEKQRLFCFRFNHYVWQFLIFLVFMYFVLV